MSNWHDDKYGSLCNCKLSDAWRCNREKNGDGIACRCPCHRYILNQPAAPRAEESK